MQSFETNYPENSMKTCKDFCSLPNTTSFELVYRAKNVKDLLEELLHQFSVFWVK